MSAARSGAAEERAHVLVVDDEEAMRVSLDALLSPEFQVSTADSVAAAQARLGSAPFQVVLTDHQMPKGSGLELLRHLHHRHPTIVGILVTANASYPEVRAAQREWREFRIILKPYDPEALLGIVRNAAVFARLRQATTSLGRNLNRSPLH
jgi:DNA-binding NtrC family response regulator